MSESILPLLKDYQKKLADRFLALVRKHEEEEQKYNELMATIDPNQLIPFRGLDIDINYANADPTLSVFYEPQDQGDG